MKVRIREEESENIGLEKDQLRKWVGMKDRKKEDENKKIGKRIKVNNWGKDERKKRGRMKVGKKRTVNTYS